eukprot:1161541-Pelagomonas_calceolata.AAC.7
MHLSHICHLIGLEHQHMVYVSYSHSPACRTRASACASEAQSPHILACCPPCPAPAAAAGVAAEAAVRLEGAPGTRCAKQG